MIQQNKFNSDYNQIIEFLSLKQDYQNIIDNILEGQVYVSFDYTIDALYKNIYINLQRKIYQIPVFTQSTFYLPFKQDDSIINYLSEYKELEFLKFKKVRSNQSKVMIDIEKTLQNINELKEINKNTTITNNNIIHPSRKDYKDNYNLLLDYIKNNFENNHSKKDFIFILNVNYRNNEYFLQKIPYNNIYDNLNNVFFIDNYDIDLRDLYPFNTLLFQEKKESNFTIDLKAYKNTSYIFDKEKTIEKILLKNNLKNF